MNSFPKRTWVPIKGECPACGHGGGWCTVSTDGQVILCKRASTTNPVAQRDGSTAWLHLIENLPNGSKVTGLSKKEVKRLSRNEIDAMLKQFKTALTGERLKKLSDSLGVSEKSLRAYGIGYATTYSAKTPCYSAPMYDGQLRPIGIHLRSGDGRKLAVPGSHNGLFMPTGWDAGSIAPWLEENDWPLLLVTPEGLSDCCAAFDLGFRAIGRPSCCGGGEVLHQLLKAAEPKQEVILIAERDGPIYLRDGTPLWPGREGALAVAERILPVCGTLRYALTPDGIKDLREWVGKGGLAAVITEAIMGSVKINEQWIERQKALIVGRKAAQRKKVAAA